MNAGQIEGVTGAAARKPRRRLKWAALFGLVLAGALLAFCRDTVMEILRLHRPLASSNGVLVLEDNDPNFQFPPFEDTVFRFLPDGEPVAAVRDAGICETVGGRRSLSVSPDGRFFVVCSIVGRTIAAYELETGRRLWRVGGDFMSASVSSRGTVYAATSDGTVYGEETVASGSDGRILKQMAGAALTWWKTPNTRRCGWWAKPSGNAIST